MCPRLRIDWCAPITSNIRLELRSISGEVQSWRKPCLWCAKEHDLFFLLALCSYVEAPSTATQMCTAATVLKEANACKYAALQQRGHVKDHCQRLQTFWLADDAQPARTKTKQPSQSSEACACCLLSDPVQALVPLH
jgi:hypothetical protein